MSPARNPADHLSDGDLFLLAFPPAGEPEPLPEHLAACAGCARRLGEWRRAARQVAVRPAASDEDFERAVMARVRALPSPRRRRASGFPFAAAAAAAAIAAAVWLGGRSAPRTAAPPPEAAGAAMNARDLADDALLRDVARLVAADDDAGWKTMAPLPAPGEGRS